MKDTLKGTAGIQYDYAWSEVDGSQSRTKHADVNHASTSSINGAFDKKLALLNAALKDIGFDIDLTDPKWGYQESQGQTNRKVLEPLDCADYPGVILPGHVCAMPMS